MWSRLHIISYPILKCASRLVQRLLVKQSNVRGLYGFFVRRSGLGGNLDTAAVMDFVDSGHDLILAADATTSEAIREIATECGADFDEVL